MFQYYVLRDGQEISHYVSITNTFLASLLSFLKEVPSLENVRAVTNSSVSMLSKTGLKKLINNVPGFKDFYIGLLEWALCGIDSSRHNLLDEHIARFYQFSCHRTGPSIGNRLRVL